MFKRSTPRPGHEIGEKALPQKKSSSVGDLKWNFRVANHRARKPRERYEARPALGRRGLVETRKKKNTLA